MIRKFAGHDTDNPPGCINYEKPFVEAVKDYDREQLQIALSEAFERGYRIGYQSAKVEAQAALNPSSENSR